MIDNFDYRKNKKCLDCGKLIVNASTRCRPCSAIARTGKYHPKIPKGEKSPHWRGGIGIYRALVTIDKCELCDNKDSLIVHHKDQNRRNNNLSNLQVLCYPCHSNIHNIVKNIYHNENCLFCGKKLENINRNYCPKSDKEGCYKKRVSINNRRVSQKTYWKNHDRIRERRKKERIRDIVKVRKRSRDFYSKHKDEINKKRREERAIKKYGK